MTPDPITTAREALPYVYHPGVSPKLWAESLAKVKAAFDYAEKLQSAISVTQEEGRTEIARLEAEVEKLKAERDELEKSVSAHWKEIEHLNAATDSEITRLTSQLDRYKAVLGEAESRVMALVGATDNYNKGLAAYQQAPHLIPKPDDRAAIQAFNDLRRAASQWIKDRQAKGEG